MVEEYQIRECVYRVAFRALLNLRIGFGKQSTGEEYRLGDVGHRLAHVHAGFFHQRVGSFNLRSSRLSLSDDTSSRRETYSWNRLTASSMAGASSSTRSGLTR